MEFALCIIFFGFACYWVGKQIGHHTHDSRTKDEREIEKLKYERNSEPWERSWNDIHKSNNENH
jgi:hypothetical protein